MTKLLPCRFCGTVPELVLRNIAPGVAPLRYVTHACRGPEMGTTEAAKAMWNADNAPADQAGRSAP